MTKMKHLLVGFGLAVSLAACAPDDGPAVPGYQTDVKPILDANCVRCHGYGDRLNGDPGLTGMLKGKIPLLTFLDRYDTPKPCPGGLTECLGAKDGAARVGLYITLPNYDRMPPAPSEALSDRDIGILKRWAAETPAPKP